MKLAVLVSGSGTILEAIFESGVEVALVISDRPCRALEVARSNSTEALLLERTLFNEDFDRDGYTSQLVDSLLSHGIEVVAMAGFGTVLTKAMHDAYKDRVLNTHPSLLPSFPGWHAVRMALDYGVKLTGCTVHLATLEVDSGPIIAQEAVPVLPDDTEATLHERIKAVERMLYPKAILQFIGDISGD